MIKRILLIFLLGLGYLVSNAQVGQFERVFVNQNFVPPQDTIINPVRIGELRFRQQDTSIYASISLSGRKWYKAVSGGVIGDAANNYVTGINYNPSNGIFTLTRLGLSNLTTSINIPVYNGSETRVQAGAGGISVTGIGTTGNPYIISATQDGNNYPVAMTYTGGVLSLDRNGLTTITVPIPVGENNFPTSLQYTGTTLTLARNGLSPLTTTIPQDGNNYPTTLAYINGVLTMNRAGLPALTANIPALDTNVVSTRANRQKGLDSLGALTKARVFLSGDSSVSITRRTGFLADTIDIRSADTLVETVFISSGNTVTIDYIEGLNGDTIDLNVSVGPGAIDTNVLSTKAWNQKGLDSLGALTKARYYFSSDNSVGVQRKLGLLQDSIDITSLDTTVSVFFMSGDNSVTIDYRQGELEDTFDLRVTIPEGVGDNWGSQFAYTNGTLLGNGLVTNPLAIDTTSMFFTRWATKQFVRDSLVTFYTGDGNLPTNRNVGIGTNELRFFTTDGSQLRLSQSNGLRYNGIVGAALFPLLRVQNNDAGLITGLASGSTGGIRIISGAGNFGTFDDSVRTTSVYASNTVNGVFAQSVVGLDGFTALINARDSVVFGINGLPLPRLVYQRYAPILSPYQLVHKFYSDSSVNTRHLNMLFQDEGIALGTTGTTTVVNFTGAGVTSSRTGNTVTVNIPGATGGGGTGTVTSVGLTMPAAFTVSGSPITTTGTFSVTANGNAGQYITGAGTLAAFPSIPTYDGSETKLQAGSNISITGLGTTPSPYVISGNAGTVTSVSLTAPPAFNVLGSPITGSGTLQLTAAGTVSQYIRGDGTLASFPVIPIYDGSETKLSAGSNVTITGAGTIASPYVISSTAGGGGSGTVTSVGLSAFSGITVSNSPITTSGTISLSTNLSGLLYGTGSGFAAASVTSPLVFSGGTLSMTQAGIASNGWLSSANWNTFNLKQQPLQLQDEGINVGTSGGTSTINFVGAGVTATNSSGVVTVTIPGAAADQNNYVTGASVSGGILTINRLGLSNVTTSFTSDAVPEGTTNRYYLDSRARAAISMTTTGNSGPSSYNNTTGVINVPNYTLAGLGGEPIITPGLVTEVWLGNKTWATLNTSIVPESGNLYFTNARSRLAVSLTTLGNSGPSTYNNITGVFNIPNYTLAGLGGEPIITAPYLPNRYWNGYKQFVILNTDSIPEGTTNQYFTQTKARNSISATAPLNYVSATGVMSITQATTSTNGFLTSTDWNTFNNKQAGIQFRDEGINVGPLRTIDVINFTGGVTASAVGNTLTVNIPSATSVQYQDEGVNTGGSGAVSTINFTGAGVSSTFSSGTLTVAIAGGAGADGNNYTSSISTANGLITLVRDGLAPNIFDSLSTTRVVEGTNRYFTEARSRASISLTTTGNSGSSTYDNITGILNVPTYTLTGLGGVPTSRTLTINGVAQDLSANRSWSVGTVTSVSALTIGTSGTDITSSVANSSTTPVITLNIPTSSAVNRGALSSSDWTTFNGKQDPISLTTSGTSGPSTFIANVLNIPNYTLVGLGGTPLTRTLTINGVTQDLNANRTWSVGTVTSVGITLGTSGTDASVSGSPVTSSGNITLNLPSASSTNRGLLTAANWTYFNAKQDPISLTTTGNSGAATLVGTTLNIPNYTLVGLGGVPIARTLTINGVTQDLSANRTFNVGTVTSVGAVGGTGISVTGSPVTTSGTFTITNTAPDQVVTINGTSGISVTGTYPNFTVSGANAVHATKGSIAASAPFILADARTSTIGVYELSNKVLKVGSSADDNLRTITVNATFYATQGSFTLGNYTAIGTIPAGFEPTGIVQFSLPDNVANTGNPATAFYRGQLSVPIRNLCLMSNVDGYIDPINRTIYVRIGSVSQYALYDDTIHGPQNVVVIPINITYFRNPND